MAHEIGEAIGALSREINHQFEAEVAVPGDSQVLSDLAATRVPTSSYMLNLLLGGGVPMGRVMEIFGDPSHGKSTIVQHMMCGFQKFPGISILLDAESSWDRTRAVAMGHDSSRHLHLQADTVELGFDVIISTIKRMRMAGSKFSPATPVGIFWDTISASQTDGEKTGDQYKDGMMDKARKIRRNLRTLSLLLPATNCALIFVNQTITDISSKYAKKTTPGGSAVKFWASKRLSVWSGEKMHYPTQNTGILVTVKSVKDKLDPPNREVSLPIRHATGVDIAYEVLNYLMDNSNIVNKSGSRVEIIGFEEEPTKIGYHKQASEKVVQYPGLLDYLQACAAEVWMEKNA